MALLPVGRGNGPYKNMNIYKKSVKFLIFIVITIILIMGFISFIEKQYIFHPNKDIYSTPEDLGLKYDDIMFTTEDGLKLNGWFVPGKMDSQTRESMDPQNSESMNTLLWFHGNAGNISHRIENIEMLYDRLLVNIFIFDYRQFGKSEGKISEQGTYIDARAALKYLHSRKDVDPEKIIFFGRSLGSAVAVDLALKEKCRALILESPFSSIKEMVKALYPFLPISYFVRTKYDTLSKIRDVKAPVLIIHGDKDDLVPIEQGRKLYETANGPKEFYTIPEANHNDTYIAGGEKYFDVIRRFVSKQE